MFDIGFWELLLISIVALLVVGPERLPGLARTAGLWLGKGRRFLSSVKADIDRELKAEELKRILKEQQDSNPLHEIVEEASEAVKDAERIASAASPSSSDAQAKPSDSTAKQADEK